jgi:hypothetical protein
MKLKKYYTRGGFVVYWDAFGEFSAPEDISHELGGGMDWIYSTHERQEFILTDVAVAILGNNAITRQYLYCKSSLLSVPPQDRLMVAEPLSVQKYARQHRRPIPRYHVVGGDPMDEPEYIELQVNALSLLFSPLAPALVFWPAHDQELFNAKTSGTMQQQQRQQQRSCAAPLWMKNLGHSDFKRQNSF